MNLSHLGEQIDIHGGGNDLVFPHHENEIAQTESFTGKQFARYWMHNGMLQLQGEKMSKSLGNLVTIDDFLSRHEPDSLRMMVLGGSYRAPLSYSDDIVEAAERGLDRLRSALKASSGERPGCLRRNPRSTGSTDRALPNKLSSTPWTMISTLPAGWQLSSNWFG